MSDVNNSGSCGIQDLNEVLKDTDMTSTEKTETLSKIKNKIYIMQTAITCFLLKLFWDKSCL